MVSLMVSNRILWSPFIGATIDRQFDYNHTLDIPAQGGVAADQFRLTQAGTFYGAEAGVRATSRSGVSVGVTSFYSHSAGQDAAGA